jgi:ketosteroid isomerase-like protein
VSADLERLRRGLDALWKRGDWDTAFAGLPDDFVSRDHAFGVGFDADGPEAFQARFRDWFDAYEDFRSNYELEDLGEGLILNLVDTSGRGRASGVPTEMSFAQVWRFRDGVPRSVDWYRDRAAALTAVRGEDAA